MNRRVFKDKVRFFDFKGRALLFAIRAFCANSIIPGTSVMPNGSPVDVNFFFGDVAELLDKAH